MAKIKVTGRFEGTFSFVTNVDDAEFYAFGGEDGLSDAYDTGSDVLCVADTALDADSWTSDPDIDEVEIELVDPPVPRECRTCTHYCADDKTCEEWGEEFDPKDYCEDLWEPKPTS